MYANVNVENIITGIVLSTNVFGWLRYLLLTKLYSAHVMVLD